MARFQKTTQKYDHSGTKVPKGLNGIKEHNKANPDCIIFDSKSEYELYHKLKEAEEKGEIQNLECQKTFHLIDKRKWWNNVKERWDIIRELVYITDFVFEREGQRIALDCKGWKKNIDKETGKVKFAVYYDEIYKIKKKLFLSLYPEYVFEEM